MVIGGQAVLVHGVVRLTRDIDITLGLSAEDLPRVKALIADLSLQPLVDVDSFARETMVIPRGILEPSARRPHSLAVALRT